MKREIVIILLLTLLLTGCGDTMVYIPDRADERRGTVVYIPAKPAEDAASMPSESTAPDVFVTTEPEKKNTATIGRKPSGSSDAGSAGNTGQAGTQPPASEPPAYDISGYVVGNLEYAMLNRINEHRAEEGHGELVLDEYLCAVASYRSFEASRLWSHSRPDGRSYETVLADYGYGGSAAGELLGHATGDGAAIVDKWMNSESHRKLLMNGSSVVGIGVYSAGGVTYVTCLLIG